MSTVPPTRSYAAQIVLWVGAILALPLWRELREPSQTLWNVFLAIFLIGTVVGAFVGVRYLQKNGIEVGEARFTTSDRDAD